MPIDAPPTRSLGADPLLGQSMEAVSLASRTPAVVARSAVQGSALWQPLEVIQPGHPRPVSACVRLQRLEASGKEVSDKAPTCPNCGVPIARPVLSHEDLTDERITAILEDGIAEFASDGWYVHQRGFGYASLQKKTGFLHRVGLAMWVEDDGTLEVKLMGEAGPLGVRRY